MPDLTPPPHEPMDDATRARIGARLTAATGAPAAGVRAPRWLAPVGAAAAVLLIASVAGWAALGPDDRATPAAPTSPTSAATEPSQPPPSEAPVPDSKCAGYAEQKVPGAAVVASLQLPDGTAAIFANDDRSVLCEDSGGIVTAHPVRTSTPAGSELTRDQLGFSSSIYDFSPRLMVGSYVAGGPLPEGVSGITYTFPGDHEVDAQVVVDERGRGWWLMAYVPQDGLMTDPKQNRLELDPVVVDYTVRDASVEPVTLEWGRDDCAHVNHGC